MLDGGRIGVGAHHLLPVGLKDDEDDNRDGNELDGRLEELRLPAQAEYAPGAFLGRDAQPVA